MQVELRKCEDVTVIEIKGTLSIEETQPFKKLCNQSWALGRLVFDMAQVSFVGSTGIQHFMQMLQTLDQKNEFGLRMVGVRSEFRRMIGSLELQKVQIHEDLFEAIASFSQVVEEPLDLEIKILPTGVENLDPEQLMPPNSGFEGH